MPAMICTLTISWTLEGGRRREIATDRRRAACPSISELDTIQEGLEPCSLRGDIRDSAAGNAARIVKYD